MKRLLLLALLSLLLLPPVAEAGGRTTATPITVSLAVLKGSGSGTVSMPTLDDRLGQLGITTFAALWSASPDKLAKGLEILEVRIENGTYGRETLTLGDLDPRAPARLVAQLQSHRDGVKGSAALTEAALAQVLQAP